MAKFTIGSDPEAFMINNRSGLVVSAKRFTDGTKSEPEDLGNGYAILNDNVLIEGNVPISYSKAEFCAHMTNLWNFMNDRASKRNAHLENADCMDISDALLETDEAKEFGCSSFRDAWNELLEIDTPQLTGRKRPAGCHIHIGFENKSDSFKMALVRAFDMFVTLPMIDLSGMNYRTSNLYGILGACRIKDYGVECRSLGGTWFNKSQFDSIYDMVEYAFDFAEKHEDLLINLPTITTYIGSDRIDIVKKYRNMLYA